MKYIANKLRYKNIAYNRCSNSGLLLPPIRLGLWHNIGAWSRKRRQLNENLHALNNKEFNRSKIDEINRYTTESNINIWKKSSRY